MFLMENTVYLVLTLMVFSVVFLGLVVVPYHGVISLMVISFLCCVIMVVLGRTYAALVMYIVYLGGLIVVFGYCVSVEKGDGVVEMVEGLYKLFLVLGVVLVMWVMVLIFGGMEDLLVYEGWEGWSCLEINGGAVFYFKGGLGLMMCTWGLVVTLFTVLVVLGWSRKGGFRPF